MPNVKGLATEGAEKNMKDRDDSPAPEGCQRRLVRSGFGVPPGAGMKTLPQIRKIVESVAPNLSADELEKLLRVIRDVRNESFTAGSGVNVGRIPESQEQF